MILQKQQQQLVNTVCRWASKVPFFSFFASCCMFVSIVKHVRSFFTMHFVFCGKKPHNYTLVTYSQCGKMISSSGGQGQHGARRTDILYDKLFSDDNASSFSIITSAL